MSQELHCYITCNLLHVILSQYNVFTGICYFILILLSDSPLTFPKCLRSYTNIVTSILRNDYRISLYRCNAKTTYNSYITCILLKLYKRVICTLCKCYRVMLHYRNVYYTPLTLRESLQSYTNIVTSMLRNDN